MNVRPSTLRMRPPSTLRTRPRRASHWLAAAAVLLIVVAGCSTAQAGTTSTAGPTGASQSVQFTDTYVKAAPKTGAMPMSAIFGVLRNTSSTDVTVVSATSDAAETVELHEMIMDNGTMKMQPKQGGFALPAGDSVTLDPGGLHVMLIGLTRDIRPGDSVPVTLTLSDGTTVTATAIGRDLANAKESYQPSGSPSSHG